LPTPRSLPLRLLKTSRNQRLDLRRLTNGKVLVHSVDLSPSDRVGHRRMPPHSLPLPKPQRWAVAMRDVTMPMVASASSKPFLEGSGMISAAPIKLPKTIDGRRPKKSEVPKGECLCDYCTAICCRYFALPIDTPEEAKDYDFIRWFLLHDRASVFVDDGVWYLLVHTNCKHLQSDFRCGIYETRPQICRDYTTEQCEYDEDTVYDMYFETAEQVAEYAEARVIAPYTENIRSPEPPMLPVLR